jgi:hypothetical protein
MCFSASCVILAKGKGGPTVLHEIIASNPVKDTISIWVEWVVIMSTVIDKGVKWHQARQHNE